MFLVPSVLLIGLLSLIVYQDFRYRALSVYLLAGAVLASIGNSILINGWKQGFGFAGMNVLLTVIQLTGITVYFSIRNKAFTNILNNYLGTGDVLFYMVLAFAFSPLNYVLFILLSCLLILLFYAFAGPYQRGKTIPFAGWLAVFLIIVIAVSLPGKLNLYDDSCFAARLVNRFM